MKLQQIKPMLQRQKIQSVLQKLKPIVRQNPYKFPWWMLTTASTASSFIDHPILGDASLNEMGLHEKRVALTYQLAQKRRQKLAKYLSKDELQQFQQNGFIFKENFVDEADFAALKKELLERPLPTRETLQGDAVTRRMALDYRSLSKLPETQKLLNSKRWQSLINYVGSFKLKPMYYVQVIISHVWKSTKDPQTNLHSDSFHPSMKAWLFLNDVSEEEGPFVYVPGSHILNDQRLAWERQRALTIEQADQLSKRGSFRIQTEELAALGYGQPQKFAVKANTLVIADTYGFHARGESARPSTRVEIWAFARRNPFLPWVGWDPASLPGVSTRIIPVYWWLLDQVEKKGIRKNPWRDVGMRYATDPAQVTSK